MPDCPANPVSYDEAITRAEEIVEVLTRGTVTLDDALALYEEGHALGTRALAHLERAEQRVKELAERDGSIAFVDVLPRGSRPTT